MRTVDGIIVLVWLMFLAYQDWKEREISVMCIMIMSLYEVVHIIGILVIQGSLVEHLLGSIVGGFFVLSSKISREKLGYGDSIVLLILAIHLGIWEFFGVGILIFMSSYIYIFIAYIFKKLQKDGTIPFIPFILLGYIGGLLL